MSSKYSEYLNLYLYLQIWKSTSTWFKYFEKCVCVCALRVKISTGLPLVQYGTQQDLTKMIDLVNLRGQKDRLHTENGGLRKGTRQDLNKMVDMVKFGGGQGVKTSPRCRKWGQNRGAYLLTLKEGVPTPPHYSGDMIEVFKMTHGLYGEATTNDFRYET